MALEVDGVAWLVDKEFEDAITALVDAVVGDNTPREAEETVSVGLGHFGTELEAALAYDRAAILIYGDDAETNFPPEESEHVVLSDEVMRQINALKGGRGRLH
jgi:hypothetical protein